MKAEVINKKQKVAPSAPPVKTNAKQQERRDQGRRVVHERFRVLICTQDGVAGGAKPIVGVVTDISYSGMGIIADTNLRPGMKVVLRLQGRFLEGDIQAEVRWSNPLPTAGKVLKAVEFPWRLGLKITPGSEEETELLRSILRAM